MCVKARKKLAAPARRDPRLTNVGPCPGRAVILNPNGTNRAVSQPDGSTAPRLRFVLVVTSSGVSGLGWVRGILISVLSEYPGSSVESGIGSILSLAGFVPAEFRTGLRAVCWETRCARSSSAHEAVELNSIPDRIVSANQRDSLPPTWTGRNGRVR